MFDTPRLLLRKTTLEDAPFYLELMNSPDWLKYIGDRGVDTLAKVEAYMQEKYLSKADGALGKFVVVLKEGARPIGTCGLYQRENLDYPDIGFAFLPEYVGKGYGYEAASALLDYAFNALNLPEVFGFTLPENLASIKLLEKLGLKIIGTYAMVEDPEELLLFQIKKQNL